MSCYLQVADDRCKLFYEPIMLGSKSTITVLGTMFPCEFSSKNILLGVLYGVCSLFGSSAGVFFMPAGFNPCSRQYSCQQLSPICIPAWPMWIDMHSLWNIKDNYINISYIIQLACDEKCFVFLLYCTVSECMATWSRLNRFNVYCLYIKYNTYNMYHFNKNVWKFWYKLRILLWVFNRIFHTVKQKKNENNRNLFSKVYNSNWIIIVQIFI